MLYVADPPAGRVVVLSTEDGSVQAVLREGLHEPVDVAVAPGGRVYVADRAGGRIVTFTPRFGPAGAFVPRNADGLPVTPKPVAVMVDPGDAPVSAGDATPAAGSAPTILVADATHPRLLRFDAGGSPLADVRVDALAGAAKAAGLSLESPQGAFAGPAPRFVAGACGPAACAPPLPGDVGVRLAQVHRDLRLLALRLRHRFNPAGVFYSAALDSGTPGVSWHKIEVDADLPDGTRLTVETATADDVHQLADGAVLDPPPAPADESDPQTADPTDGPYADENLSPDDAPRRSGPRRAAAGSRSLLRPTGPTNSCNLPPVDTCGCG